MVPRRTRLAAVTLIGIGVWRGAGAQAPELPLLRLEDTPAAVRTALEEAYREARTHPADARAVGRLGMILQAHEQWHSAATCYRTARAIAPQSAAWAYLAGVVQAEAGLDAEAAASFREALRHDPAYLPARVRLAAALMSAGELAASRAEYEALVGDYPELALAHHGLGHVLAAQGDLRAAAEHHRQAVEVAPAFGPAHYALALAYRDLGMAARAEQHLAAHREHGRRRPALPDPLLDEVEALRGTARDLITEAARIGGLGRLEESIALHRRALDRDPAAAQAHVNLISLYGRTGRIEEAETHYRAALRLGASLADAHYNFGVLLAARGRLDEAAAAFQQAIDVNPFHAQAHNNLGSLLAREGRLDEAEAHFRRALANDPQHRMARFNLGRALVLRGRHREAIEQFQRILTPEDADTPRFLHALSGAYVRSGDLRRGVEYAERARRRAEALGQTGLAARIAGELERLTKVVP